MITFDDNDMSPTSYVVLRTLYGVLHTPYSLPMDQETYKNASEAIALCTQ